MKGIIAIGVLIVMMSIFSLNSMARLRNYFKSAVSSNQTLKNMRPSLPTSMSSLNTVPIKNMLPDALQRTIQPEMLSSAYQKLQNQLPFSIKPFDLSLMVFGMMIGLPIGLMIDFNSAYNRLRKVALAAGVMKKTSFAATYPRNISGVIVPSQDELLEQLDTLADLTLSQKTFVDESHKHEAESEKGKKSQADAWLFGYVYREAIRKAINFDDIVLLYQSAFTWLHLRIQSGLKNTVADLDAEFNRIAQQETEALIVYDEKSIPVVKKYWQDLRDDLRSKFEKELEMRQKDILNK